MEHNELEVVVGQLDELLAEGAVDEEEALEIAALAGLAQRLGAEPSTLDEVARWRDERGGAALLREAWEAVDFDAYIDAIEGLLDGQADDEDVEEAIYDFDELVAAAVYCGRTDAVKKVCLEVERMIRAVPEAFVSLSADGKALAASPAVAQSLEVYGFWLAIADAAEWADPA